MENPFYPIQETPLSGHIIDTMVHILVTRATERHSKNALFPCGAQFPTGDKAINTLSVGLALL